MYALAFASLIARWLILLKWKDEAPSMHSHWIRESIAVPTDKEDLVDSKWMQTQ